VKTRYDRELGGMERGTFSTQELEARRGLAGKAQALKQPLKLRVYFTLRFGTCKRRLDRRALVYIQYSIVDT
jgi:hypothetical protein